MFLAAGEVSPDNMIGGFADQRLHAALKHMDEWLKSHKFLAGEQFTAAETMSVYAVTTQRYFGPQVSLEGYGGILRWLGECAERPAYRRAMEKGDPEMRLLIGAEAPEQGLMALGGSESDVWKK